MAPANAEWQDTMLRNAARGRASLPLETRERSRRDQLKRMLTMIAVTVVILAIVNTGILGVAGLLPGYRDPGITGPDTIDLAVIVIVCVPLGAGALLFALLWSILVQRVHDTDGHPWVFRATETDFTIVGSDGKVIQAPWTRWRYEGYRHSTYRGSKLALIGIELSVDGRPISIDVLRVRAAGQLVRAILQRLAAHGGATG